MSSKIKEKEKVLHHGNVKEHGEHEKLTVKENEENTTSKAKNYVVSTLFNTSLFVVMSFFTKAINLLFNVLIARIISKESYGLATVYFTFIFMLLLYFPRETLRKTCLKYCPDENEEMENLKFKQACHLVWLMNFGVLIMSIPMAVVFIMFGGSVSDYKIHLILYIVSAFLELVAEPAVIYLNIKIDKQYRLIGMTLANYSRLTSNYLFALLFGMDLWSFTLSRLLSCFLFLIYMFYVGIKIYKLHYSVFIPNFSGMKEVVNNKELNTTMVSFVKGTSLKMVLNYSERIVLSFFLNISNADKAEYTFIVENFATFVKYIIEPAEENFYNLINKIKHYKGLTVIPNSCEEFTGDFNANENEILVKLYSNFKKKDKNKAKDKENYSFKLLKLSLKLFFVFGVLMSAYLFLIGKDLIIFIFTEKWGTEQAVSILKVYALYIGMLAVTSVTEAYTNAICSNDKIGIHNKFMVLDAFLLIFLSFYLAQFDITGLVWANILTLILRFALNVFLIVRNEMEQGNCNSNSTISEISKFLSKSFLKTSSIISTIVCLLCLNIVKDLLKFDEENRSFMLFSAGVVFALNSILIFMVEKKGFTEIVRLRNTGGNIKP